MTSFSMKALQQRALAQFNDRLDSIVENSGGERKGIELATVLQELLEQLSNRETSLGKEAGAVLAYMNSTTGREYSLSDSADSLETLKLLNRYSVVGESGFNEEQLIDLEYRLLYFRLAYCLPDDRRALLVELYEEFAALAGWKEEMQANIQFNVAQILMGGDTAWRTVSVLGQQIVRLRYLVPVVQAGPDGLQA